MPFSYLHSTLKFSAMKIMARNSDLQSSDSKSDFFVDVGNEVADASGEVSSNLSAVLKSNQSSVTVVLFKSSSWSRFVRNSGRVPANSLYIAFSSWRRSMENMSAEFVNPSLVVFDRSSRSRSAESTSAELVVVVSSPQRRTRKKEHLRSKLPRRIQTYFSPILRSLFIERSGLVTSEASSACVKSKENAVERKDVQMELSECSCVESSSVVFRGNNELKLKSKLKKNGNANVIEDPDAVVQSEISSIESFSFDLECSENLSTNDEVFDDYSSAYSELQSDILQESSDLDFSEYSPSMWYDSSSQFSEKSLSGDCPSHSFHLSRQFSEEFFRSTYALEHSLFLEEHNIPDGFSLELEEEDGECYRMLRSRERSYNGTNGKTTTSYLIKSMHAAKGLKTGMLSTVAYYIDGYKTMSLLCIKKIGGAILSDNEGSDW